MPSLNKVMLMGNLTRDAALRYLPSNQAVLEFRLAVSRKFKTQQGDEKEETCYVDVNLWGKRGEALSHYLTKGKPLFVEGRLQLDEWDDKNTGEKRSKLRVVAENVEFLGGGRGGASGFEAGADGEAGNGYHRGPQARPAGPAPQPMNGGYPGAYAGGGAAPYPPAGPGAAPAKGGPPAQTVIDESDIPF